MERIRRASLYIFFLLLAYMPLHIFLSTWFGTTFQLLDFAKVFKDIVLVIGFVLALAVSVRQPWFKRVLKDKLTWLILAYALLTIILALVKPTDQDAEILGVVYNLRFLLFFQYAILLAHMYKPDWLKQKALRTVLIVAIPVLIFGVAQYLWLPNDFLTHAGYSRANGVLPAFFIDDKPDLERVMSTLRDPNSFGSYVLIILAIIAAYFLRVRNIDLKRALAGIGILGLMCLYFTFSRGAWLGVGIMLLALLFLQLFMKKKIKMGKWPVIVTSTLLILGTAGLFVARDSYFVQNVLLHSDETTIMEDPNELRVRFWRESLEASADNPLGYGPGTAGLASLRNNVQGGVLNENYYLQVLYETGVLGLLLFAGILAVVFRRLYHNRSDTLTLALILAFIGLAVTNLLVHIWSNEAVAYIFWGLAGFTIASTDKVGHNP